MSLFYFFFGFRVMPEFKSGIFKLMSLVSMFKQLSKPLASIVFACRKCTIFYPALTLLSKSGITWQGG